MRILMFYHSVVSDWNHGNAHFLRGVATELIHRGHDVVVYEPKDSWSRTNLESEHGNGPVEAFHQVYPQVKTALYDRHHLQVDSWLEGADLVVVHEWSDHQLVKKIGEHHNRTGGYVLLFHDTHHRMVTDHQSMEAYALEQYDGVLAYGRVLKELYAGSGRVRRAWTWHEAADTRVFRPGNTADHEGDLVWIGNWGDNERTAELQEFLFEPTRKLGLRTRVYGVRYPEHARIALAHSGIEYAGWLPNFRVPEVFSKFQVTVHVPRRPYVSALPGIPTIRPFEALACGIPLVSSPWDDAENLFTPGEDFLFAQSAREMASHLNTILKDRIFAARLAARGLNTIKKRHTCSHRVDELLAIVAEISPGRVIETNPRVSAPQPITA